MYTHRRPDGRASLLAGFMTAPFPPLARPFHLDRTDPRDTTGQIVGNGSSLDAKGTAYVNLIGQKLQDENVKVYVIGFSSLSSELESVNDIAEACGATPDAVFRAGTQGALTEVFDTIKADIINDLSSVIGPF